eukprot:tig00000402_g193.t1
MPPRERNAASLHVRNIPRDCKPDELREMFSKFGDIKDVYLPLDYYTREPRGFGFVQFVDVRDAEDAKNKMDRTMWNGRELAVMFAEGDRKDAKTMRSRDDSRSGGEERRRSRSRDRDRRRRSSRSRSRSPRRRRSVSPRRDRRRSRDRDDRRRSPDRRPPPPRRDDRDDRRSPPPRRDDRDRRDGDRDRERPRDERRRSASASPPRKRNRSRSPEDRERSPANRERSPAKGGDAGSPKKDELDA